MMSEQVDQLFTALAKAQAKFTVAEFNKTNPHFKSKYSDLQGYLSASRSALTENGLSVSQLISEQDGKPVLVTLLAHASGQWIKSVMPINPTKNDMQGFGSALSYAKRYSLGSIIGLASGEEDDDANEAVEQETKHVKEEIKPKINTNHITQEQLQEFAKVFNYCSKEYQIERQAVLRMAPHNAKSLAEMPKNIYEKELEMAKFNAKETHEKNKEKKNGENTNTK